MPKAFQFRFEQVLDVRRLKEDLVKRELAVAQQAVREQHLAIARLLAEESEARKETRAALLAYCGQDTFAMVRLVDVLRSLANLHAHEAGAP